MRDFYYPDIIRVLEVTPDLVDLTVMNMHPRGVNDLFAQLELTEIHCLVPNLESLAAQTTLSSTDPKSDLINMARSRSSSRNSTGPRSTSMLSGQGLRRLRLQNIQVTDDVRDEIGTLGIDVQLQ